MLQTYVIDLLNMIIVGAITGIGLIVQQGSGVTLSTPALQVWDENNQAMVSVTLGGDLSLSGSVVTRGAVTFRAYPSCSALETNSQGALVCGTDDAGSAGVNTGAILNVADSRYVRRSGGNMTGGLLIKNGNPAAVIDSGLLLEVVGTASGRVLAATDQLRSSGTLVVEGSATINALSSCTNLQTNAAGTLACNSAVYIVSSSLDTESELETQLTDVTNVITNNDDTDDLNEGSSNQYFTNERVDDRVDALIVDGTNISTSYNDGLNTLTINATDTNTTYSAGQGLALNGTVFSLPASISGSLLEFQTVSGAVVHAQSQLRSSGTLVVEGAVTFATLVSCENLQTASNGALSCNTTDYLTEAELDSISELETQVGVNILVNTEVDSESELETLLADVTDVFTNNDGSLADDNLSNNTLDDLSQTSLTDPNADRILFWDDSDSQHEYLTPGSNLTITGNTLDATDTNTTYTAAQGLTLLAGNSFRVNATLTGTTLRFQSVSGSTLTVSSLKNCNTLDTDGNGLLSCGTDETGGGGGGTTNTGGLLLIADNRYVNTSGDTMTGALVLTPTADTTAFFRVNDADGGHPVFVVDATNERVGIGALNPSQKLHLSGSMVLENGNTVKWKDTSGNSDTILQVLSDNRTYLQNNDNGVLIRAGTSLEHYLSLDPQGDVGIGRGMVGAASKLAVSGATIINPQGTLTTGSAVDTGIALEVIGTASGRVLHAQDALRSSGSLLIDGSAIYFNALNCSGNTNGGALTVSATGQVTCSDDDGGAGSSEWTDSGDNLYPADNAGAENVLIGGTTLANADHFFGSGGKVFLNQQRGTGAEVVISSDAYPRTFVVAANGEVIFNDDPVLGFGHVIRGSGQTIFNQVGSPLLDTFFQTDASSGLSVDASQNSVGINKNHPLSSDFWFHVGGRSQFYDSTVILDNLTVGDSIIAEDSSYATIRLTGTGGDLGAKFLWADSNDIKWYWTYLESDNSLTLNDERGSTDGTPLKFVKDVNRVGIFNANPDTELDVGGTVSGSTLFANNALLSSGSLVWEGAASGATLVVSGQFSGAGLTDCDDGTNSKLLWDATNKRFSCGTDQSGGSAGGGTTNTGGILVIADSRYVNTSGDTMTGGLAIRSGNGTVTLDTGVLLEVLGTMSGRTIHAQDSLRSSGSLLVESATNLKSTLNVSGNATFDTNTLFLDASGNRVGIGTTNPETLMEVAGAMSGNALTLSSLKSCDTIDTNANGVLTCGTDDGGVGSTYTAAQGLTLLAGDSFQVNATLTGSLIEFSTVSGSRVHAQDLLTASGQVIIDSTAASAAFAMILNITNAGAEFLRFRQADGQDAVTIGTDTGDAGAFDIYDNNGAQKIHMTGLTGDTFFNHAGDVGINTNDPDVPGAGLEVVGVMSGVSVYGNRGLSTSGSLVWEGTASGSAIRGLGLTDCDDPTDSKLLWDATLGIFACGTDQSAAGSTYFAGQGLTLNGADAFSLSAAHSGTTIEAVILLSGATVHAQNELRSSGSFVLDSTAASSAYGMTMQILNTGSEFARFLQADGQSAVTISTSTGDAGQVQLNDASGNIVISMVGTTGDSYFFSGGDVGFGTNDPNVPGVGVEVVGIMSGTTVQASSILASSGALTVEGAVTLAGLGTCDTIDSTNGLLSCGTDDGGSGGGGTTNTGGILVIADNRFVNTSGDTMTGALGIRSGNGTVTVDSGFLFEVVGGMSGRTIHAQDVLRSSGSFLLDGGFWQDGLADADGATQKVLYDLTTGKFTAGTDDDVPESGDFAAAVDLEADGSLSADVVAADEMADADHGDISWSGGVASVDANAVALTTDTSGNYAAGDAEAGAALTGDTATAFFSTGTLEVAVGGTGFGTCTDGGMVTGNGTAALTCNAILTDNQIYIGDGTTEPTAVSIPECTAAQKLQFTDSGNGLTCVTDDDVPESGDFAAGADLDSDGTITDGVIDQADLTADVLDFTELQDALDVDALTTISLGANGLVINATSTGQFEIIGAASGRTLIATDVLRSSGTLLVESGAFIDGSTFNVHSQSNRVGIGTLIPDNTLSVVGNFDVADADTSTKGYRFRTNGTFLDLDAANARMFFSIFSNADFTGTQRYKMIFDEDTDTTQLIGQLEYRLSNDGTIHHRIDGRDAGDVVLNEDNTDADFTAETDNDNDTLFVDASSDRVGINTLTPDTKLDVEDGAIRWTNSADSKSFEWDIDSTNNYFYIDEFGSARHFKIAYGGNISIGGGNTDFANNSKLEVFGTMSGHGLSVGGQVTVTRILSASASLDFPNNTTANTCSDLTITVPGAADGDVVSIGTPNGSLLATVRVWGWVSAANTVTVRYCNGATGGNPASGTFRAQVTKF